MSNSTIDDILVRFQNSIPGTPEWRSVLKDLGQFSEDNLSVTDGLSLIEAAGTRIFASSLSGSYSTAEELLSAAKRHPYYEYIAAITQYFSSFPPEARWEAHSILAKAPFREATIAWMEIVKQHPGELANIWIEPFRRSLRDPDVLFPALLRFLDTPRFVGDICQLCLAYCEERMVDTTVLIPFADTLVIAYKTIHQELQETRVRYPTSWLREQDYVEIRWKIGMVLDVMAYFTTSDVAVLLRRALDDPDDQLKFFAVSSLLRRGETVEQTYLVQIAENAEVRNLLYRRLDSLGLLHFYPEYLRTQAAFAESDMVHWLTYPTGLGCIPDEIELMKVVEIDTETTDEILEYYVFRYRMNAPDHFAGQGWLAGVSGPFLRSESPSATPPGNTFSEFRPYDAHTPEEHVGDIIEIRNRWRTSRATRG